MTRVEGSGSPRQGCSLVLVPGQAQHGKRGDTLCFAVIRNRYRVIWSRPALLRRSVLRRIEPADLGGGARGRLDGFCLHLDLYSIEQCVVH